MGCSRGRGLLLSGVPWGFAWFLGLLSLVLLFVTLDLLLNLSFCFFVGLGLLVLECLDLHDTFLGLLLLLVRASFVLPEVSNPCGGCFELGSHEQDVGLVDVSCLLGSAEGVVVESVCLLVRCL